MNHRPSSLPNLEACPRWVNRPRDPDKKSALDEAADEGTLVHRKMLELATRNVNDWPALIEADPEISPALRPIVQECAEQVKDLFGMGLPVIADPVNAVNGTVYELVTYDSDLGTIDVFNNVRDRHEFFKPDAIFCEIGVDPRVTSPGTADLVVVQGNRAVLVDYKTNRVVRSHDRQLEDYVLGIFNALSQVDYVEARIVAPRLGDTHRPVQFERKDLAELKAGLQHIVDLAEDAFTPGVPGEQCAMCAGNGRCPYQAASLRDIPIDSEALVRPGGWLQMMQPNVTPELRGERRQIIKWLEALIDFAKEDDKEWAKADVNAEMPGFTKSVQIGRAKLDDTKLAEVNDALRLTFGLAWETLVAFLSPEKTKLVEFLAMQRGISQDEAKKQVDKALAPFITRGPPVIAFRAVKKEGKAKSGPLLIP